MVCYSKAFHNYSYHAIETTVADTINATYARRMMGRLGGDTTAYTTAFLYFDWLYFLWHGTNMIRINT